MMLRSYRLFALVPLAIVLIAGPVTADPPAEQAQQQQAAGEKRKKKPTPPWQKSFKRLHQDMIQLLTDGKAERVVERMRAVLEKQQQEAAGDETLSDDGETPFMLALALGQLGKLVAAEEAMQQAIAAGLPPGRFFAGPRELVAPLRETEAYQQLLADFKHKLVQGPMLGDVSDSAVSVWVRTAQECDVTVVCEPKEPPARIKPLQGTEPQLAASAETSLKNDFTAVVRVTGLSPDTAYSYTVYVGGGAGSPAARDTFRTPPRPGTPGKFQLAFGGGAGFIPWNERVWTTIARQQPDILLMLGDNMYSDAPKVPNIQTYCYYRRQSRPEWRKLIAHVPVYAIWDDHDFGTNDCWGGPEINQPDWKVPVWNVFQQNWVNPPRAGSDEQPGCYYRFTRGDVDFLMRDGRYYRTDPKTANPSMLGPVQLSWLKEQLEDCRGTFKVICSPVPWDFRTKGQSRDTWNGFRDEREEIFSFIEKNDIEGVVLMSADRHRSDAWKIERERGYPFYEFNSSRLTNQHVHGTMAAAIFSYNAKQSFGMVRFDTTAEDPTVTYDVITIDGEQVESITVKRSELSLN